jgi:Na+/citrate or Na+/malate symporter
MNDRMYFLLGDIVSNLCIGILAGLASLALLQGSLPMLISMLLGMIIGMFIALIVGTFLFIRYFGAMEIMLPTMLTGMLAGMTPTMFMIDLPATVFTCAAIGLVILAITRWANSLLTDKGAI